MPTDNHLRNLLKSSLQTPAAPRGLESRVLRAVHLEQQRELARWYQIRQLVSVGLGIACVGSSGVFVYRFLQSSASTVVETFVMNYDVLPVQSAALALLEILPIGSIATALTATSLLFLLLSFKAPERQHQVLTLQTRTAAL